MVYSFQYVDPCAENYKSKLKFILFKLGHIVVTILIWLIVGFGIQYSIETRNTTYVDALTNWDIILIGRTLGSIWQIFNYNLGLYLFYKYPYKLQKESQEIEELDKIQLNSRGFKICSNYMSFRIMGVHIISAKF